MDISERVTCKTLRLVTVPLTQVPNGSWQQPTQ